MSTEGRWCTGCSQWLPEERFNRDTRGVLSSKCRACRAQLVRDWRERNADYVRAYNEARRVGLTEHVCAQCGKSFTGRVDARTCSQRCRDRARYLRRGGDPK